MLWELVSKELPFENETQVEIRKKILSGYKHKLPEHVVDTPLGVLIDRCWDSDPTHRPSASEICETIENILKESFVELTKDHPVKYIPNFSTLKDFYEAAYRKNNNFINTGTSSENQSGATMTLQQYFFKTLKVFNPYFWFNNQSANVEDDATEQLINRDSLTNRISDPVITPSIYGNSSVAQSVGRHMGPSASIASNKSMFNFPFRFSSRPYEHESEYILPNYLSKKNMLNIIMPPAALEAIRLVKQEKFWFDLEGSDEAWAILTPEYPFILTHATSKWYELFNVPSSFGIDFQLLSLISLVFPEIEAMSLLCSSSNTYIQNATTQNKFRDLRIQSAKEFIQRLKLHQELHTILCLHLPYMTRRPNSRHHTSRSKSSTKNRMEFLSSDSSAEDLANSFSIDTTGRINGHNMMCSVHAFPVYAPPEHDGSMNMSVGDVPPSPGRNSVQKSSSPLPISSVPESPHSTFAPPKSALRKSSKVLPLNISNTPLIQSENRVPLYYAILFNELKEEEVNLPEKTQTQPQQNYSSKNSNLHQYNSRKSKMSDLTTGTGFDDERLDDEYHPEEDEADEIYNMETGSNLADHSTNQDNQNSLWKNITKLWSSGNDKSDERKHSTNSRTVTQLLSGDELSNPVGISKGSRSHSYV